MGQISPLDQLISSTAFNDCSVTVIYSGVIITDVLLLCDGPSAPSPSSFCADVIVFFGTTPASFTVVLCNFCRLKFCLMHVCLGGLTPGHKSRCFLTNGIVKPRVRDDRIPPPPNPHPPQIKINLQPVKLPLCVEISLSCTLYYQMCIHVWVWVSMHVSNTFMCTVYVCVWESVCTDFLSSSVFFTPLVHTGESPRFHLFGCWRLLFLPWTQETRIQPCASH